jgi:hypothetical protein
VSVAERLLPGRYARVDRASVVQASQINLAVLAKAKAVEDSPPSKDA